MWAAFVSKGARMSASDLLTQPYSAMELAAFFAALMAALFVALRQRDREPGMGWFALSMALLAVWLGANRWHLPVGDELPRSAWTVMPGLVAAALTVGLARFLPLEPRWQRRHIAIGLLLTGAYVMAGLLGLASSTPLRRDAVNLLLMASYLQLALMCFWAARREPGAGSSGSGCACSRWCRWGSALRSRTCTAWCCATGPCCRSSRCSRCC